MNAAVAGYLRDLAYAQAAPPRMWGYKRAAAAIHSLGTPLTALIAQAEAHLERQPNDGRGWEVLAPVYLRLGRFDDAVKARRNALRLNGETVERQADLGEALVAATNGIVTADA